MPSGVYANNKGKTLSSITKEKISKNNARYFLGKHLSTETKKKISNSKLGVKCKEETKEKISKSNIENFKKNPSRREKCDKPGSGSRNWIPDRTSLKTDRQKMYDTKYKYWMLAVKKRDSWKCKIGDGNCKGRLEAHHILNWEDFPELRYDVNNGITLCKNHHPRGRDKEREYEPILIKLVLTHNI